MSIHSHKVSQSQVVKPQTLGDIHQNSKSLQPKVTGQSSATVSAENSSFSSSQQSKVTPGLNSGPLDILKVLDRIMKDLWNKRIEKAQTIARPTSVLRFNPNKEEPEKEATLALYLTGFETFERLSADASQWGAHTSIGLGG